MTDDFDELVNFLPLTLQKIYASSLMRFHSSNESEYSTIKFINKSSMMRRILRREIALKYACTTIIIESIRKNFS